MKKYIVLALSLLFSAGIQAQQVSEKAFNEWHSNKYSMFIHFGLYSELGGVWEGKPVTRGYSEQAPSDWNTSTHKGGLTLIILCTFGAWSRS